MKKIVFKVTPKAKCDIKAFVKSAEKVPCRMYFDMKNSQVVAEEAGEILMGTIKKFLTDFFIIEKTEIEETEPKEKVEVDEELKARLESNNNRYYPDKRGLINLTNKLYKTAENLIVYENVEFKKVAHFIYTCMDEMKRQFQDRERVEFSVGDVVNCYLGYHLHGEVNGIHVLGIVCDICNNPYNFYNDNLSDAIAYIVPVVDYRCFDAKMSNKKLEIPIPEAVEFAFGYCDPGVALLDKGRYIRVSRINNVEYSLTEDFFNEVLYKLPSAYKFPRLPEIKVSESESWLKSTLTQTSNKSEKALLEAIGQQIAKLNPNGLTEDELYDFVLDLGFPISNELLMQSFYEAMITKYISYSTLIPKLQQSNSELKENAIKTDLRETFKDWLEKYYPDVAEKNPKISFISLLKIFSRRFS